MLNQFVMFDEDGVAALTTAGNILFIVIGILALLAVSFFTGKNRKFHPKTLVFSAVAIAIAFVLSYVKLFRMPWGGSVTLLSMLFVTLVGFWYGPAVGFTAAFTYGMLQFVQGGGGYILSPLQVCLDYIFAFTALGASGFFRKGKYAMQTGYVVAILLRGLFHAIGGYLYWMDYMPENFPASLAAVYPFCYNYAYILAEAVITLIIISLPPVKQALLKVKEMTVE